MKPSVRTVTALLTVLLAACAPLEAPQAPGPALPAPPPPAQDEAPTPGAARQRDPEPASGTAASEATPPDVRAPEAGAAAAARLAVETFCRQIGDVLGSVSAEGCRSHDLQYGGARSHEGHPLLYRDHPAATQRAERNPKVLVIGGIHADEYSSISIVFRWLERLDAQADPARDWRLIPLANPDGLLSIRPARRTNARGVDLNRNFATDDWERDATSYWRRTTASDPRRMPGSGPASEPETRWLQALIENWRPDVIVSIHAPRGLLDFDGPVSTRLRPPQRLGFLHLQPIGTYPGSLGRYGSEALAIPVLTLELPRAGTMPTAEEQDALWQDLHGWLDRHLSATVAGRDAAPAAFSPPR